jgi:general stress protein 26
MSRSHDALVAAEAERLIAGATAAVVGIRNFWLVTEAETGGIHTRPIERLKREPEDDPWTIRFLTDGRSRKAEEMRREGRVTLLFQSAADDCFVAVTGAARLCPEAKEGGRRWRRGFDAYFPTAFDRAQAVFAEIDAARLELRIRGVTPEPFGLAASLLEREPGGAWRLVGGEPEAG